MILNDLIALKWRDNQTAPLFLSALASGRSDDALAALGRLTDREAAIVAALLPIAEIARRTAAKALRDGDMCPAEVSATIRAAKLHDELRALAGL